MAAYRLTGTIEPFSPASLDSLLAQRGADVPDTLVINSPGGDVTEGKRIAAWVHENRLAVRIEGEAASMASYIAMHGRKVVMVETAILMIHNPWTVAAGDAEDLRSQADALDAIGESLASAYVAKTGLPKAQILELMNSETWMSAEEALALGFVDAIEMLDGKKIKESPALTLAAHRTTVFAQALARPKGSRPGAPSIDTKMEDQSKTIEALRAEVAALQDKLAAAEAAQVDIALQTAEQAGQIDAEARESLKALGLSGKQVIAVLAMRQAKTEALPKTEPAKSLASQAKSTPSQPDERAAWTHRDWEKKDPSGLRRMYREQPERAQALAQAQYIKA